MLKAFSEKDSVFSRLKIESDTSPVIYRGKLMFHRAGIPIQRYIQHKDYLIVFRRLPKLCGILRNGWSPICKSRPGFLLSDWPDLPIPTAELLLTSGYQMQLRQKLHHYILLLYKRNN